jgi:hypothetical protein
MRPFASTPVARTMDTVIWSFNGENCSFHHLNWINILNKEDILYVRHVKQAVNGPHVVCGPHDNTNVTHMALGGPSV